MFSVNCVLAVLLIILFPFLSLSQRWAGIDETSRGGLRKRECVSSEVSDDTILGHSDEPKDTAQIPPSPLAYLLSRSIQFKTLLE